MPIVSQTESQSSPEAPPLDHPSARHYWRVYFALTNHCNRACPWCSTCSSPHGNTWLSLHDFTAALPAAGEFAVQLEGGEPTLHPRFWEFVDAARRHPRCRQLVLCTNGVVLPRGRWELRDWLERLGESCTVKLSVNHYLLERDVGLLRLAAAIRDLFAELPGQRELLINVRLRRGEPGGDAWVRDAVIRAGLMDWANVFFLQRYGLAENRDDWERPFLAGSIFTMINPDGRDFGQDLIARSEGMRALLKRDMALQREGDGALSRLGRGKADGAGEADKSGEAGEPAVRFNPEWRRQKYRAFDLMINSTAQRTITFDLQGRSLTAYANANLSIYSARECNGNCPFCVEKLRPASRGSTLVEQKQVETDDSVYFAALENTLRALALLGPSVSITGGEPSLDPRLPRLLRVLQAQAMRKRTMTTNGSGLLLTREGRQVLDWVIDTGLQHLNISTAHWDCELSAKIMRVDGGLDRDGLREVVKRARAGGTRVRLSCVLLEGAVDDMQGVLSFLDAAISLGVDNVVFRQLMRTDAATATADDVVLYNERHRVDMDVILEEVSRDAGFRFIRQVMGYYYYVEVWQYRGVDVVFEAADLAQLERDRASGNVVHEFVFHPNARLCSTWQPWDGILI